MRPDLHQLAGSADATTQCAAAPPAQALAARQVIEMGSPILSARQRSAVVTGLDLLCLAAIAIVAFIAFTDVDRFRLFGIRVSLRSPTRALVWPVGIVALRWSLWRRAPLFPAFREPVATLLRALKRTLVNGVNAVGRKLRLWRSRFIDRAHAERFGFTNSAAASDHLTYYVGALVVLCLVPLWPHLRNVRAVLDPGDPFFSAWRLAWVAHQIVAAPGHLFDANIFYPTPLTLTYSDSTLLPGVVAAPFIWANADPLTVANVMFLGAFPLAGLAFFFAARRLTGDLQSSFIAGLLGGLAPFHFEHYSHFELQFFFWVPLAIIALLNALTSARLSAGVALGALVAGQCLTSMYFGAMLLTYLVPFGLAIVLGWQVRPNWRLARALLASAAIVATTLAILGAPYLRSRTVRGEWSLELLRTYSAMPADYLQSNYQSATYRTLLRDNPQLERQLFPGAAPLAFGLMALIPPMPVPAVAALVAGALAADWSLGVNGFTHRFLYRWLAPYRSMRVPARFALFVGSSLILLSAFGALRLLRVARSWQARTALFAALIVLVLADVWPHLRLRSYFLSKPTIYGAVSSNMILAEFPMLLQANIAYSYFSTAHWAKMVNGYSGYLPKSYELLETQMRAFPSTESLETLRQHGVTHITVNCAFYQRRSSCLEALAALDSRVDVRLVTAGKWNGEEVRLYRLAFSEASPRGGS
jgi:hypothetical protein